MNTKPDDTESVVEDRNESKKSNTIFKRFSTLTDVFKRPDYWGGMLGYVIPLFIYVKIFLPGGLPDTDWMWLHPLILGGPGGVLAGKIGKDIVIRGVDEGFIRYGLGILGGIIAAAIAIFFRLNRILV